MFKKLFFMIIGISLLCMQTISYAAQTTLDFQNPKKPAETISAPISPNDFANQVKATNTQNHNQFKQQLDQQKNELSHPKIPSLNEVQTLSQAPPPPPVSTETESTENTVTNEHKQTKESSVASPSSAPSTVTQDLTTPPVMPTAPPPPPVSPSTAPTQSQPYTGFVGPSQPAGTAPAPSQQNNKTGGFNIKY